MSLPQTSRRSFLVAAAASLALVGCSNDDDSGSKGSSSGSAKASGSNGAAASGLMPAGEGTTTYPLTVKTAYGDVKIPKRPERIVPIWSTQDAEYLSMLGVTPVSVPASIDDDVWMKDAFPNKPAATFDDSGDALPYEAIAKAKPDVIVAMFRVEKDEFTKLSAIAPVLAAKTVAEKATKNAETWQDKLATVAEALDLQAAGKKAVEKHDAAMKKVRDEHPEFAGKTITYAVYYGNSDYGMTFNNGSNSNSERILTDMGFAKNPNAAQYADDIKVSNEKLSTLDADVMLLSDNSVQEGGKSTLSKVTDLGLFKNLGVVKNKHLVTLTNPGDSFIVDGTKHEGNPAWAFNAAGPMAEEWAAKTLAPYLSAALKK